MSNEKEQYPKKIVTIEKITEDSEETKEVITIVNNEYEEKAVKVAIAWMDAWNKRDEMGCDNTTNFPHIRLSMSGLGITKKSPILPPKFFERFIKVTGWNHSCWDYRRVVHSGENKVHLAIQYSRFRSDGTRIGTYPSLWVITNQEGHWGIKIRSSFAQ